MRFPLLGKLAALGGVMLLLLVALGEVDDLIDERQMRMQEAERSVADSLAGPQQLIGPVLQRRCEESWERSIGEGKDKQLVTERREFVLAATPKTLDADAKLTLEPRYRGIFKVNGYAMKATLRAGWAEPAALRPKAEQPASRLSCDAPRLFVGVGDARGLRHVALTLQGQAFDVLPGTPRSAVPQGFQAELPAAWIDEHRSWQADIELDLIGTGVLAIAPVGESTQVRMTSNWPHPSFHGRFLPNTRAVTPEGFSATWQLSALATSAPRDVLGDAKGVETFGVSFIDPVNPYVLSDRATKYGALFILLTFVGVALMETLRRLRVHPIQYLLVGCALALFFLLLVSLTEHIGFGWAYLAASAAVSGLLAFYGSALLGGLRPGLGFGAAVALLYASLYGLLQLEQTALVLGALLLFAVLAAAMATTRRLDWYGLLDQLRRHQQQVPPAAATPAARVG